MTAGFQRVVTRLGSMSPSGSGDGVIQNLVGAPPLILCGPSGAGKSTLMKLLTSEFPAQFGFSVSHTTRAPRQGEESGKHYHFTTKLEMEALIGEGKFLEYAVFSGNMYGTSKEAVAKVAREGKICILDIDMQGVKQLKAGGLQAHFIFIQPPSLKVLEERLKARATETEESLKRRLAAAKGEMEYGEGEDNFHLVIVNDEVERAYAELKQFMLPSIEKLKSF